MATAKFTGRLTGAGLVEAVMAHPVKRRGPAGSPASPGLPAGAGVAEIRARDVPVTVAYRLDSGEHRRRRTVPLTAVTRLDWLDTLLDMPLGIPVPPCSLSQGRRRVLRELPYGCVASTGEMLVRRLARPLRVDLVVAVTADWRTGLARVGRFGGYATRAVAVTGCPRDLTYARMEAGYYGIGLVLNAADDPVVAVPPERFVPTAHTPAGWRFEEQVYGEIVTAEHATP